MKNSWPPQWNEKKKWLALWGFPIVVILILALLANVVPDAKPRKGTWIWDTQTMKSDREEILAFAKQNGVTDIYLYVDLDHATPEDYARFIIEASKEQIRVEALGGDPSWGLKEKRPYIQEFINWVGSYNTNVREEERFSGIHFDIEPYLLPEWKTDQDVVLEEWLSNLEFVAKEVRLSSGLKVSLDVPFWIDQIKVPGYADYSVSRWMLKRFDSLALMNYRDQADGKDGMVSHALDIVKEASSLKKSVIVGVEMAPSGEGDKATFYEEGVQAMEQELEKTQDQLKKHQGFQGFAIHGFPSWVSSSKKENQNKKGEYR